MCLRQGQAVIFHIIAYGALYFFDVVHTACHGAYHVHPENVLHAGAGDGAVVLFRHFIQAVGDGGSRCPRIDGLFTGGNHIDAAGQASFQMRQHIRHEAEQRHHGNVGVAFVQHGVRVRADGYVQLYAKLGVIAHVHAHNVGVGVNGAHNFRALLVQIAQRILAHFAAAILYNPHFFQIHHTGLILSFQAHARRVRRGMPAPCLQCKGCMRYKVKLANSIKI